MNSVHKAKDFIEKFRKENSEFPVPFYVNWARIEISRARTALAKMEIGKADYDDLSLEIDLVKSTVDSIEKNALPREPRSRAL